MKSFISGITKSLEENNDDNSIFKLVSAINDVLESPWMQSFKKSKDDFGSEKNFQLKFFAKQVSYFLFVMIMYSR